MKRILITSTILLLITGCGPVKIEGDVFLVKGDGKPQPSAAKEVIFVRAESFEDILIESYLESIQADVKRNAEVISEICNSGSAIMISDKEHTQDTLNGRIASGKANNVTDQDGSCTSFQKQFDDASSSAMTSRNNFDELIAKEERKKTNAKAELINLKNKLKQKTANREDALYEGFISDIEIAVVTRPKGRYSSSSSPSSYISVLNNSKYNIKTEGDMCFQFYNAEGNKVGITQTTTGLGDCGGYSSSSYQANGTVLWANMINSANRSTDEFGFSRGGYVKPGQSSEPSSTGYSVKQSFFCGRSKTPSETLRLTKKYGEDQASWPDLSKHDPSKGYMILVPQNSNNYSSYGDKSACGLQGTGASKFIALEDEVRIEVGDRITYTSKPISFRKIAEAETYEERDLIKTQEEIIRITEKEIQSITDRSIENPLLANELDARSNLDQCSVLTAKNDRDQEQIAWVDESLGQTLKCDLDDADLFETLLNVGLSPTDENRLGSILETDYSTEAAYAALKRFSDSEYKSSTNISGHYVMGAIPKGNYVMYSSYQDNFIEGIYLDNIEISGEALIDLSNTKFHEVGSLTSVIDVFYEDCSGKICSESDLRYTLDINEAERRYEKRKQDAEDFKETLRELERLLGN